VEENNINQSQNPNEEQQNEINEPPKENQEEEKKMNEYANYEQNQFNEFMKKLMLIESQVEDAKLELAKNPDFNCEDAFRLFETNYKGYLDINDIKSGLNLIGLNPTEKELNLLMKRFDIQKNGFINYADFFDMVVPFEKNIRELVEKRRPSTVCPIRSPKIFKEKTIADLKNLFELLIKSEDDINNDRKTLGTLRLKLKDIFGLLDKDGKGYFDVEEMVVYLANNGLLDNNRDADLLFIRLDKNRNGKIDYPEVEDELQTLY
jgi:Ca2+-binding EF-hand superfamily protein